MDKDGAPQDRCVAYYKEAFFSEDEKAQAKRPLKRGLCPFSFRIIVFKLRGIEACFEPWRFLHTEVNPLLPSSRLKSLKLELPWRISDCSPAISSFLETCEPVSSLIRRELDYIKGSCSFL